MHITRYYMYKEIGEYFRKNPIRGKVLGISGIENFYPFIDKEKSELTEVFYPKVDMQDLPFKNNTFDFVISDQVIEHLEDPFRAVAESYRVLKRGGIGVFATVLITPIHEAPKDYWRFTPDGLKHLCSKFSKVIECGSWGNRVVVGITLISDHLRFIPVKEIPINPILYLANWNEKKYPITTWIIAEK
jgi:SAM-dependent methyltransferase